MVYTDRFMQGRVMYNAFMAIVVPSLAAEKDLKKYPSNILQTLKHISPLPLLQSVGLLNRLIITSFW